MGENNIETIFRVSLFESKYDTTPKPAERTWQMICERMQKPHVRKEKDGALFSPAVFDPPHRKKENVLEVSLLVLDYDHGADFDRDTALWRGQTFAAYTTHSSYRVTESNPDAEERFRVIVPFVEPIPASEFPALWQWAARMSCDKVDASAKDASRMFYTPAIASPDARYRFVLHDGAPLDWRSLNLGAEAQCQPVARESSPSNNDQALRNSYVQAALRDEAAAVLMASNGSRNNQLNKSAFALGQLVGAGVLTEGEVEGTLERAAIGARLSTGEALATIRSGVTAGIKEPREPPEAKTTKKAKTPTKKTEAVRAGNEAQSGFKPFVVADSGIWATDAAAGGDKLFICSKLEIAAYTRNDQSEDWGRLLEWTDRDGVSHSWLMPLSLLAGDAAAMREYLLSGGLEINPGRKARDLLTIYIQTAKTDKRARCVSRIGWHGQSFVLPDETIGNNSGEKIVLQSLAVDDHRLRVSGSLEEWREKVAHYCIGNSRLVFSASCGFAPPLLGLFEEPNGGFHFRALSSLGKTTTQHVAGSVCGGGDPQRGYLRTWRATANGLEAVAELHNDGLLLLDELAECDPRTAGEVAYMLANGEGKQRMARNVRARKTLKWRMLFISSGEISLAQHVAQAERQVRAGQEVRLCDIEADAGSGFGVFEELHGFNTGDEFARYLESASKRYYGSALRDFIRKLTPQIETVKTAGRNFIKAKLAEWIPENASGEVYRAARRFALVAFAGELATTEGITGWCEGEATQAAKRLFDDWLAGRGTAGSADDEAAIAQVRAFLEKHGSCRFERNGDDKIVNRAGFIRETADSKEFCILPETFRKEVCAGFDSKAVLKALVARGYLVKGDGKNWPANRHSPSERKSVRVFVVNHRVFESEESEESEG